jgi:hypothetical protein
MYQARTALAAVNDATVARPAPLMPSGGSGPIPNIKTGTSRMCRASAVRYTTAQHGCLAGAADHAGQGAQQPIGERAGKDRVRIFQSGGVRVAGAAHKCINGRTAHQQNRREDRGHSGGDDDAMNGKRGGVRMTVGADGARDGRRNRSAHARVGHLLHEHDERKNEREAGQGARPHLADEMGIYARGHGNQHDVDDDVGAGKAQQRRDDRPFEKKTRPPSVAAGRAGAAWAIEPLPLVIGPPGPRHGGRSSAWTKRLGRPGGCVKARLAAHYPISRPRGNVSFLGLD